MSTKGFSWGGAGLFNLSASFKAVGEEPAPTALLRMVQAFSYILTRAIHGLISVN